MSTATNEKKVSGVNSSLNDAVIRATLDTFRDMLQANITNDEPREVSLNRSTEDFCETTVVISFVGEISGAFVFKCSKKTGAVIASRMLGMEIAPESDEVKDALGELLNIIIGSAKSYYSTEIKFRISVPTTIIGQNYSLYIKADAGTTVSFIPFTSGTAKMGIEIYLK